MSNLNKIYLPSFILIFFFTIFSIFQINNVINQYFLGVDIGDARLYLDAFFNKELNLNEYLIEFKSKSGKILDKIEKIENLQKIVITKENSNSNIQKPFKKRKFQKRKFVKKKIK